MGVSESKLVEMLCAKSRKAEPEPMPAPPRAGLLQELTAETAKELLLHYADAKSTRLYLGEYLALLTDPRLSDGSSPQPGMRIPDKVALAAFSQACGLSAGRMHPSYSMSLDQLVVALGQCGVSLLHPTRCSAVSVRELLQSHAAKCPPRLFLDEYLALLADSRLDDGLGRPSEEKARLAFARAAGLAPGRMHPSYSISVDQLVLALGYCGVRFIYPSRDDASLTSQSGPSLRELVLGFRSPPRLFLDEFVALVEDPRLSPVNGASRPTKARACTAFGLACSCGPRLHPNYSLSLEQLALALSHCAMHFPAL